MSKKLFTKVVSLSLTAAMVLSMAPINAGAAKKTAKPKSMKVSKSSKIKVGQTKTISATRKAKKSTTDVKYVNFKPKNTKNIGISVKSSDDAVVSVEKVNNGKYTYTGVNTGTATLTVTSRAKTSKNKKLKAKINVTVINPFRVTQTGSHAFTMSTADKLEKAPDKRDIKVTQEGSTVDNAVKEVKLAEDKMSVEVTMEIPFVDQKKYEVEFGKNKDSFVASVGAPATVNIKTQSAVINKATKIEYAIVDAKGMDITKTVDSAKISVDVKTKSGYHDTKENKLTLWKVGDTAEVVVTYHTWTYDQKTGKENVIEGKATVTCVDKSAVTVTGLDKWTIAERVLSWDTDEMKTVISAGKSSKIWVRMKKSDGTYVNNKDDKNDFSFEPISTATLYVYSNGSVYATREGMEYAKVTYYDGTVKYQYTLPITVGAKAKASSVVLNQAFVTIASKNTTVPTMITMKVLDQYGEAIESPSLDAADHLSGSKVANITQGDLSKDTTIRKIKVVGNGTEGTGVYKLTARVGSDSLNITLTVNARDVSSISANNYMLKAEVDEFDVTLREDTKVADADDIAKGITLDLYATKAGLIDDKANAKMNLAGAEFTINGVKVAPAANTKLEKAVDGQLTFKPVIKDAKNQYISLLKAGVYTITVKFKDGDKTYVSSTSVVVKNDTAKAEKDKSYKVEKIAATADMPYQNVTKAIVDKTDARPNMVAEQTLKDNSIVLAIKDGKATKVPSGEGAGAITTLDALKSEVYIDTAVLPSFRLDNGAKPTVWVLEERLNQKVDNLESGIGIMDFKNKTTVATPNSAVFGITDEFEGDIKTVSLKDEAGSTLAFTKIYMKSDSSMADKKALFDAVNTKIDGTIAGNNAKLKVKLKNDTPAGTYVAEVKYTLNGKDYFSRVEFEVTKADFANVNDIVVNADNELDYTAAQNVTVELKADLVNPVVTVGEAKTIKVTSDKASTHKENTITVSYDATTKKLKFDLDKAAEIASDASAAATGEVNITVSDANHKEKKFTIKGKGSGVTLVAADKKVTVTIVAAP